MDSVKDLNLYHLIIIPAYPQNVEIFREEYVDKYCEVIRGTKALSYYSICLEHKQGNLHLDILVWMKGRIDNSLTAKNSKLKKINAEFCHKNPATKDHTYFKVQKAKDKEEDILYLIGYNLKEQDKYSWDQTIPPSLREEGIKWFAENEKTKKKHKFLNVNALKPSNLVCYMVEHYHDNDLPNVKETIMSMVKGSFSFVGISEKAQLKANLEFKLKTGQELTNSEKYEFLKSNGLQLDIDKEPWFIALQDNERKIRAINKVLYKNADTIWCGEIMEPSTEKSETQIKEIMAIISS